MPWQYSRMRDNPLDLYTERDALPWYFRTFALIASWLALGGYILFALVFTSAQSNIRLSRFILTLVASVFLFVGYAVSAATAFYGRSLLFAFDGVLLPILTSSVMGLFVTAMNQVLNVDFPVPTRAYIYVPLVTACLTTVASAVLCYITHRRMSKVNGIDRKRSRHLQRRDRGSSASHGDVTSTTELLPVQGLQPPEDEAQRQQFLRLLLNRDSLHSPNFQGLPSTYQITLPGEDGPDELQVVTSVGHPPSGGVPSTPSRWNILNKLTRDRSHNLDNLNDNDPREHRRQQIERASSQNQVWAGLSSARYA